MAIILHERYAKDVEKKFTLDSIVAGKTANKYSFEGVKTVNIPTIITQPLNDYKRTGVNRYGEPQEVQDTMQSVTLEVDKSFALTVDKGNNTEQQAIKGAGTVLRVQMDEQVIPAYDKRAFAQWTKFAGKVATVSAALTSSNVYKEIIKARTHFVNSKINMKEGRFFLGVPASVYELLLENEHFIQADKLNAELLTNGVVGKIARMLVVEVPDEYLPTGVQFIVWHADCVEAPKKIWDTNLHMNPPGISGHLLEGRFIYDGFVLGEKANGVYALGLSGSKLATPTLSGTTLTCANATLIKYTNDGSDPRYSMTAKVYSAKVEGASGATIKAVGFAEDKLTSDVAVLTLA